MNPMTKLAAAAPIHNLILYRRPLHPELFVMKARRALSVPLGHKGALEFEAWLMPLGHMLRLQSKTHCFCELVTDRDNGLPTQGVLTTFPTAGERDFEQLFEDAAILYTTSSQTENLSARLYQSTLHDMRALAKETGAMVHEWELEGSAGAVSSSGAGVCMSMVEVQRFDDELHASSTHMHPVTGLVLRTQTVFQRV